MISPPKFVSVVACGVLLCLGLSTSAQADKAAPTADKLKAGQSDRRQGGQGAGESRALDSLSPSGHGSPR
jgi:hypothetical protein